MSQGLPPPVASSSLSCGGAPSAPGSVRLATPRHRLAVSEGEARLVARVVEIPLACRAAAVIKASRRSCNARADV